MGLFSKKYIKTFILMLRYYFNHDYVVDHRIGLMVPRTGNVMNGELSPFTDALRLAEKTSKLEHGVRKES